MRLTYRDVIATVLAACFVGVTLSITQDWTWPMLGTPRAGIVALGVLGFGACALATRTQDMATKEELARHPGMIIGSALGAVALILLVVGLFIGTEAWLVALAVTLLALWAVATVRHAYTPLERKDQVVPTGRLAGVH